MGGQVLGGDIPSDIDIGATQPETPNHQHTHGKRDKKDKRKHDSRSTKQVGPAIVIKKESQDLKHGHDPNKINSIISKRHIIVEPSTRHMNYQASTRNISVDPMPAVVKSPQKSMRHMGAFDKKSSMRNMGSGAKSMRNMGGSSKNTMRNSPSKMGTSNARVANVNVEFYDKTISTRNMLSMGPIDETISTSNNLGSIDENNSQNTNLNGGITSSTIHNKQNGSTSNTKALTRTPITNSIDESAVQSILPKLGTIEESSSASRNSSNKQVDAPGKTPGSQKSNSSTSSHRGSPISTSVKSTASTATTKSTTSSSTKGMDNVSNLHNSNSSMSSHSKSLTNSPVGLTKQTLSNSVSSIGNKSANSLSARSEKTRSTDNRTKSRNPPRKRGPSLVTPAHFNRDRPSTVLITRKEMEDILAEKQREEALEAKTMPPKSGTMSTDLWLTAANKESVSEEFSVASGTSVEEESPFGKKPQLSQSGDEYDISFFDITEEEEITEHTINTGNESFDAKDLHFTDSIEQRCTTIRFDEYDELQTCLHINDYTNGEIARSWYKREDYDKMVDLARKTASKAVKREKELRDELENMLRTSVSPPRAGRKNGELLDPPAGDDNKSTRSGRSTGSTGPDGKKKKPIEYRGLEAWTPEGSQKCRTLKENAIELVWNEQSRQWEEGTFDPDAIAAVYMPVAKIALNAAQERAIADEKMVKRLAQQEKKKKAKSGFQKSRSAIRKAAKSTGKVAGKVIAETGKSTVKIGKRSGKALVATATLDPKMMKEAVKIRVHGKKKRECKHELEVTTSKAAVERDIEELEASGSISLQDSGSLSANNPHPLDRRQLLQMQKPGYQRPTLPTTYEIDMSSDKVSDDLSSATGNINSDFRDGSARPSESDSNVSSPKKKSRLKLLGVVPIPGTQKKYSEDRRAEREEKRKEKMTRRPSWEASMTTGKH